MSKQSIIIDECVTNKLAKYLRRKGLEDVISISEDPRLRSINDETVMRLCYYDDAILITKDVELYYTYEGRKIFYNRRVSWFELYKKIVSMC